LLQFENPRLQVEAQSPSKQSSDMAPVVLHARLHCPQCRVSSRVFSQPSFAAGLQSTMLAPPKQA